MSKMDKWELDNYYGGKDAYIAKANVELTVAQARLAAGMQPDDGVGMFGEAVTEAEWTRMMQTKIQNIINAIRENF